MNTFLQRLQSDTLTLTVELRPPRADLGTHKSIDTWMAMHSTVRRLTARNVPIFITDGAVGTDEEENLQHLLSNLDRELARNLVCPFLTTKHSLEYCEWFAARTVDAGCEALTVLGGDKNVGAPRCVPHGYELRKRFRKRFDGLALGGWANPHHNPERQAGYLQDADFTSDFYLTQLVTHHHLPIVDRFLDATKGIDMPGVFGVFYYRSAKRATLERLSRFFEVPVDSVIADFESGLSAAEVCAASITALARRGVTNVYISNLHPERAPRQFKAIVAALPEDLRPAR